MVPRPVDTERIVFTTFFFSESRGFYSGTTVVFEIRSRATLLLLLYAVLAKTSAIRFTAYVIIKRNEFAKNTRGSFRIYADTPPKYGLAARDSLTLCFEGITMSFIS